MNKQEIITKVNELVNAPTVCAPLKSAAEEYLKAQNEKTANALVDALKTSVNTIDETIAFAESDMGKKVFGEERAAGMAAKGHEAKTKGAKYCFCPACTVGGEIYENRNVL